jgi:hypothetical protein
MDQVSRSLPMFGFEMKWIAVKKREAISQMDAATVVNSDM